MHPEPLRAQTDLSVASPAVPAPPQAAPAPDATGTNKWVVLAVIAAGVFMATLDSSIVNISLPTIATAFGVPLGGAVEWIIIAYLVVIAAVLLSVGRLADLVGRKPLWVAGLAIFTVGSALCGLAPSLGLLIAMRAVQGLGSALLFAVSPAMLIAAFPPQQRGRALGLNAVTVALGISIGPTLGGIITQSLSWRWIFFVNVPIGALAILATLRFLRERALRGQGRFDPLGAVLLAVALAGLTGGLSFGQELGWTSPLILTDGLVVIAAIVALVITEQRVSDPVLDFALFRIRVFASANVSLLLSFLALFAVGFLLPFYFEQLRGFSVVESGLLLTPLSLMIALIAPFSGALADRIGTRWLAAGGLALACLGLVLLSELTATSSLPDIVWRLMVTGTGQALFQSPNNSALLGSAPPGRQGVASGLLATGRVVGQSTSVALAGSLFAIFGGAAAGGQLTALRQGQPAVDPGTVAALQHSFLTGFHAALLTCACVAAIGVFTSLARGSTRPQRG